MPRSTTPRESPTESQPDTQASETIQAIKSIIERVKQQSMESSDWVSEPLIRGQYVVVTISANGGALTLWLKPTTLRNGYPVIIDNDIEARIAELEDTVNTLKSLLPVLKEYAISRKRSTIRNDAPIIIRRKF